MGSLWGHCGIGVFLSLCLGGTRGVGERGASDHSAITQRSIGQDMDSAQTIWAGPLARREALDEPGMSYMSSWLAGFGSDARGSVGQSGKRV